MGTTWKFKTTGEDNCDRAVTHEFRTLNDAMQKAKQMILSGKKNVTITTPGGLIYREANFDLLIGTRRQPLDF